ncbi:MAG: hypothetical protein E6772_11145 [Dysgonomonas sp.]|nr:hypothetical protein [Dysgonomonas sp.]
MKIISYNGGVVSFRLPENWIEEYYPEEGAAFYRDDNESGTLRLNVLSAEPDTDKIIENITLGTDSKLSVEEGYPLKEQIKYINEDGQNILVYLWEIHVPVQDSKPRIILFTYTISASQENDPIIVQELNFVRNTILTAHYSQEKGI